MTDDQLLRYSRHLLLEDWGIEGQERVCAAHALVIGAGGLGSPVALYLGSAGVGRITVIDHDRVDVTNLQRQIAHTQDRVGQFKVDSVRQAIAQINPEVHVVPLLRFCTLMWLKPMWCLTAATTLPRGTLSTWPACNTLAHWSQDRPSV